MIQMEKIEGIGIGEETSVKFHELFS